MSRDAPQGPHALKHIPLEAVCAKAVVGIFEGLHQLIVRLYLFVAAAQRDAQPKKLRGLFSDLGDRTKRLTSRRSDRSNLVAGFAPPWRVLDTSSFELGLGNSFGPCEIAGESPPILASGSRRGTASLARR